jgi:O-antigen/teichoic acid export membrane protein
MVLPVSTFLGGILAAWQAMANRLRLYTVIAVIQIVIVVLTVIVSITLGFLEYGYAGLMVAYLLGQIVTFSIYWLVMHQNNKNLKKVKKKHMLAVARKHKDFSLYTTPTAFIENFSLQAPIYALSFMGDLNLIGLFNRARQLITMPFSLFGSSIATVFQRQAAVAYADKGTCRKLYVKTFCSLLSLGVVPTAVLMIWAPDIFELYLGSNWREAGYIVRILAPMLLLRLLSAPLATVFYIAGKQKEDLMISIIALALVLFSVFISVLLKNTIWVVISFSIAYSIVYLVYIIRSFKHSLRRHNNML